MSLNLIDVNTKAVLGSWTLTRRSDLPVADIQASLIAAFSEDLRTRIAPRITAIAQPHASYPICFEGLRDYLSYQKILEALSAMDGVESIEISSIRGHAICHTARIKGRLEDVMQAFQSRQSARFDILVKDESAWVILNR
jgi:hypothetical protein